jgi:hypothetical protein
MPEQLSAAVSHHSQINFGPDATAKNERTAGRLTTEEKLL